MQQQLNFDIHSADPRVSFLSGMRRLVIDEAEATRRRIQQGWSQPIPVRVANAFAIEGLRIEQATPGSTATLVLVCGQNHSRFREGDILCLNQGDPFSPRRAMVTLESDDETTLVVSIEELGLNIAELLTQRGSWILDEGYLDLSHYFLDALDEVADGAVGRERVLPLLMGLLKPELDVQRWERGMSLGDIYGLNDSQAEAFANAYAADLAHLIQGPPGTGKTRVLAHLAQALVEDGERVLITCRGYFARPPAPASGWPILCCGHAPRTSRLWQRLARMCDVASTGRGRRGFGLGWEAFLSGPGWSSGWASSMSRPKNRVVRSRTSRLSTGWSGTSPHDGHDHREGARARAIRQGAWNSQPSI